VTHNRIRRAIFVSSFFSHLPRETFTRWLRQLYSLLTPVGLLCISVHDEVMLPPGADLSDDGFYFQPSTELDDINAADYGATVVSESFMVRTIGDATGQNRYRRLPTALCFAQDIYLVQASSTVALSLEGVSHGAQGCLDTCQISDEWVLTAQGWAGIQDHDDAVSSVEVRVDGRFVARIPTGASRIDVATVFHQPASSDLARSGWSCEVKLDFAPTVDDVVMLTAVTRMGRRDVVWSTPLRAFHTGVEIPISVDTSVAEDMPADVEVPVPAEMHVTEEPPVTLCTPMAELSSARATQLAPELVRRAVRKLGRTLRRSKRWIDSTSPAATEDSPT